MSEGEDTASRPTEGAGKQDAEAAHLEADQVRALVVAAVQQHSVALEEAREGYRRFLHKRRHVFHFPFALTADDLQTINGTILRAVERLRGDTPVRFTGIVRLKDRREVIFNDCDELAQWNEPEKSHPIRLHGNWTFPYIPEGSSVPIPLFYDIDIDYETEPDVANKRFLGIEEEIVLEIEGPDLTWLRSLSEELTAAIDGTSMPWWWRSVRWFISNFRPFFNQGIFFASIFMVFLIWSFFYASSNKQQVAAAIYATRDIVEKFDLYIQDWASPGPLATYFTFMLVGFVIAGAIYLLISLAYDHIAPPSIISIGITGKRRMLIIKAYSTIWLVAIGAIVALLLRRAVG